jgi:putative transposase
MTTWPGLSMRKVCKVLKCPPSPARARAVITKAPARDEVLAELIQCLIAVHPTFGYRRLWTLLRFGVGIRVNGKAVYRVLRFKGCGWSISVW